MIAARGAHKLRAMPVAVSAFLHLAAVAPFVFVRSTPPVAMPPMYRVDLVAAPPGPRAEGIVTEAPAPPVPVKNVPKPAAKAPPPKAPPKAPAKAPPKAPPKASPKARATRPLVKATPTVAPATAAPKVEDVAKAGGGEVGSGGSDVASIHLEGIVFPYEGYLRNIERQIALNFSAKPSWGALKAEVFFFIRRDGSVSGFRFRTRSGSQLFDLEAQGAVEAAARAFGSLPTGWPDDVLPVIFFFDPSKLR